MAVHRYTCLFFFCIFATKVSGNTLFDISLYNFKEFKTNKFDNIILPNEVLSKLLHVYNNFFLFWWIFCYLGKNQIDLPMLSISLFSGLGDLS